MSGQIPTEPIKLPVTIRPDPFTYFLGVVLSLVFWTPLIVTIVSGHWDWKLFAFSFGLTAALLSLIHGCRIVLTEKGLAYIRLFLGFRYVAFSDMEELKIELGRKRSKPIYRLLILSRAKNTEPITINIKLFSRNGLSNLMKIISVKAPAAHLDSRCEKMKDKIMPFFILDQQMPFN